MSVTESTLSSTGKWQWGKASVYIDGCCKPNPGQMGIGIVFFNEEHAVKHALNDRVGCGTNNVAEWIALVKALQEAKALGVKQLVIRSDSQLIVNQFHGVWQTRQDLQQYRVLARTLAEGFDQCQLFHIPREQNSIADKLANEAFKH